jgi:addiction module RelE/StbE family toxin
VADLAFSPRALASLRRVARYLRERNPAAAERVLAEIERSCELLREHPWMGPPVPGTGLRRHVTRRYRYRVIYRVVGDLVEVRDVMHPRRDG